MPCLELLSHAAAAAMLAWLARITALAAPTPDDTCEIQVEGLPVPARSHHRLELSGGYVRLANDGTRIKVGVEPITVRLVGPRYTGEVQMAARDCTDDNVVVLHAIPRPAVVVFVTQAPDMIVQCTTCEGEIGRRPWRATELPPIPVDHGEAHRFEIRAPGYRVLRRKVWLMPGENRVEIELVPLRS
jgi:hypothetical protein